MTLNPPLFLNDGASGPTGPFIVVSLLFMLLLAGCGDESSASRDDGSSVEASAAGDSENFEANACDYLTEAEVRRIFDLPPSTTFTTTSPCTYVWDGSEPPSATATDVPEYRAGINYVVADAANVEAAKETFASAARDRSRADMEKNAERAAEIVKEDAAERNISRETARETLGDAIDHEAVNGIGDDAAWESSHGSLVVRAGTLVFRAVAYRSHYEIDPASGQGETVTHQYPDKAAAVARAALTK